MLLPPWRTREALSNGSSVIIPSVIDVSAGENEACISAIYAVDVSDKSDSVSESINGPPCPYFLPL